MEKQVMSLSIPRIVLQDAQQVADHRGETRAAVLRRAMSIGLTELRNPKPEKEKENDR